MADQKDSNQLARELKQLGVKEPDPSNLNKWELRGRNVYEELKTPSMRSPSPGLINVHSIV